MAIKKKKESSSKKKEAGVKIYSTPVCHWCTKAKEFFKEHKIKFKEIDVSKDHKAAQEMIKKSGQMGVPVIEIGSKIIIGFDEEEVRETLDLQV